VTRPLSTTRWAAACLGLLLLGLTTCCAAGAGPKRVLLIQSFGNSVAPFRIGATTFETTLTDAMGKKVDIDEVTLEMARYQQPGLREVVLEDAFVEFLSKRDANWKPDLVVTIGSPAGRFVAKYRNRLFPQTPVLYSSMDWGILMTLDALKTNAAYVGTKLNIAGFGQDILQLVPDTTNLVVVIGASPLEQVWADRFRSELASCTNRLHLTFLNNLSFEEMQKQVTRLPAHSFIFLVLMIEDVEGVAHTEGETLRRMHDVANAPINAIWQNRLGEGIVGGRLYDAETIGVQSARVAERILNGEPASAIPPWIQAAGPPQYDWRELQRWHIPESRLPTGSSIQFRPPGLWELYRWPIVGVVAFCLLQTALIFGLLVNRAKRRQTEATATLLADISSKFVNLPADEVDREIINAQGRIFELLGLDVSGFWRWSAEASGFFRITHYSRSGEDLRIPEQMDAREYLPWFQQQVLAGRTIAVASMEELPPEAARDRETFRRFGFKSNLTIPLSVGGGPPIGALGFNTTRAERKWPDVLVKQLQLVAQMFANALARKRADEALQESEERMTVAAKATGLGFWLWNIPGDEIWGSERWLVLFGFTPGTPVTFEKVIQRIHPIDRQRVEAGVGRGLADRSDYLEDFRVLLPDGTERWIAARGRVYRDSHGKPARMVGTAIDITLRKRTELALAESELRYRTLFETAPEGILLIGTDGHVHAANPAQARLYGYESPQQLEGLYAPLFVAEKDRERAAEIMKECLSGEEPPVRQYTAARRDGSEFIVEVTSAIIRGPHQRVEGYLCLTRDITESKQAEAAVRESEERFRIVADSAPVLIWMSGLDKLCTFFNKSWLDFTGRTVEQEMGNGWTEGVYPDDLPGCLKIYGDSFDARQPFVMQYRLRHHNGEYRWISDTGVPRHDAQGNFAGYIGSCVDITDRKQVEESLRESEQRFRQVAETVGEFIWEVDARGLYTYASPSVERILGYTPEELVGKMHFYDLIEPSVRQDLKAVVLQVFANKQTFRDFSKPNVNKTGKIVHLETSGVPMLDSVGNLSGYRGADTDVTARKEAEAEVLRERAELAHVARVSTLGELAASMAHELNQPLGAILANAEAAELFLKQNPPALDDLRAILADVRKDDERAGEVIRRMRGLLRKHELERLPLEINTLVEDVLQLVSGDAALRGVSLAADLAPIRLRVSGDRVHLQQVLLNLILNSLDALADQPRDRRQILVRTRLGADGRVELAVIDSGRGIEPERLSRLFEPFYTTKPNGMGMGLSIARTIIEAHRGRIWAENNPSGGAVFRIALPVGGEEPTAGGE